MARAQLGSPWSLCMMPLKVDEKFFFLGQGEGVSGCAHALLQCGISRLVQVPFRDRNKHAVLPPSYLHMLPLATPGM